MAIEYYEGDALAKLEEALGRVPLVPGVNGRIALISGLAPGQTLDAADLAVLAKTPEELWADKGADDVLKLGEADAQAALDAQAAAAKVAP